MVPPLPDKIHSLDGMRGWAALFVVFYHVFCDGMPASPFAREMLRKFLPFNGMTAVCLFFVLSGFVLSLSFVKTGERVQLIKTASGRYFRLAIPIASVCALVFLALKTGLILPVEARPAPFDQLLTFDPDPIDLLRFSLFDVFFDYQFAETFAAPLWTMGIELMGSFVVLGGLFLLGRTRWRWAAYGVAFVGFWVANSFYTLFVAGALMADLYASYRPNLNAKSAWALVGVGVLLPMIGPWEVWVGNVSAISLFAAVCFAGLGTGALSGSVSRWLGRVSFPLYLIHGPVMFVFVPMFMWAEADNVKLLAVQIAVVAASLAASHALVPVNKLAVRVSRAVGKTMVNIIRPAEKIGA